MSEGLKAAVETIEKGVAALRDHDELAAYDIQNVLDSVKLDHVEELQPKPVQPALRTVGVG